MANNYTSTTVTCHTCQLPIIQANAQPIQLLVPSCRYRDGRELPRITRETVYECEQCQDAYFATLEQMLPLYS